jgi:formiminoglutamate deiminase
MNTYWCELAWLGGERVEAGVLLEVVDDRIAGVVPGTPEPPPGAERIAGLTLPGLVNVHSHAFQRALRGRTQGGEGSFWTWRERMYELAATLDPDSYLALARATFGEMALAGVTLVGEFHYLHHAPGGRPYSDPNAMGRALIQAAAEAGVRLTLIDACYLAGGIGQPLEGAQLRFGDGDGGGWAARADGLEEGPMARIAAAIHSVRAVPPEQIGPVVEWAHQKGRPLHVHLSEQPAENQACLEAYGKTPARVLADAGAVNGALVAVHGTHLDSADLGLLGEARAGVCLCPTTERDLADGIGPARAMREAGIRLTVGSDSNAVVDLFEEARAVELDERLATGRRGSHRAADLLLAATQAGGAALCWPGAGTIAVAKLADLAVIGLDSVRLAGTPTEDLLEAVVFAATAADVRQVMVGGRWIVRGGAHVSLDVARELAAAIPG